MNYTDPDNEQDLIEWEAEHRDDLFFGDPRRCPSHPHVRTSSDDGMFDGPCWECEAAMGGEYFEWSSPEEWAHELLRVGVAKAVMTSPLWIAEFDRRAAERVAVGPVQRRHSVLKEEKRTWLTDSSRHKTFASGTDSTIIARPIG